MKPTSQVDAVESIETGDAITTILVHHLNAFMEKDLPTLMSDYTEGSVFITQDATYTGIMEIRRFFVGLMVYFPKEGSVLELDKMAVKGKLGYIVWHAKTPTLVVPFATDTFIVEDGKIMHQTFAGQMEFITD